MKPKNSLERVLAVLEVFSEERLEWTPEDLMRELGYSRPTLYRYLKILKDAGFLMSTRNAGVTLGPKVVEMDYLTRRSDPLVLLGAPYLKAADGGPFLHGDGSALVRQQDPLRGLRILHQKPDQFLSARPADAAGAWRDRALDPGAAAAATPAAADRAQSRRSARGRSRRHRR